MVLSVSACQCVRNLKQGSGQVVPPGVGFRTSSVTEAEKKWCGNEGCLLRKLCRETNPIILVKSTRVAACALTCEHQGTWQSCDRKVIVQLQ